MKLIFQHDLMDCGPACLAMICAEHGKPHSLTFLRDNCFLSKDGVSFAGIEEGATKMGFECFGAKLNIDTLVKESHNLPCILHWEQDHFVVLYKIKKSRFSNRYGFYIADPSYGLISLSEEAFSESWLSDSDSGLALFLAPTESFYENEAVQTNSISLKYVISHLSPYKKELFQIFFGLLASSLFTLFFPFLTQALIDKGVSSGNLNIVYVILVAQIFLFVGSTVIDLVRNWVVLYIGTRINISIISNFLRKILSLPIKFFDIKMIGDINQRIQDHDKVEKFLTSQSFMTVFSLINILVFFIVLLNYNYTILLAYGGFTTIAIIWSVFFLRRRKYLNYFLFRIKAQNQDSIFELISGIQEVKLNNFEDYKRNNWEDVQVKLFNLNLRILRLDQLQIVGFEFLNQLKNIFVTYIAAREVILGNISLGTMLSISYIIGQLNSPINQLLVFFRSLQDARLSLERLNEIQEQQEEEGSELSKFNQVSESTPLVNQSGFKLNNISFQYEGPKSPFVLKNIDLNIPYGKITAIVGASGSGKTTLMKLLLLFYSPTVGEVIINEQKLSQISPGDWRKNCGVVMQDGFIFGDTIKRNIATRDLEIDSHKYQGAVKTANIDSFINNLPLGDNTKIGSAGSGISGGQKQRILIARAVYKNPDFIFFDEATSALDSENEKVIHDNLNEFFRGKTVIMIAHRLSTVKNADQIVVLKDGEIAEIGSHEQLVDNRGVYFKLIQNQLELGT